MIDAITLNDACELIVDSEHKTAPIQDEGYPYIRTPNIGRGRLILGSVRRVGQEAYDQWTRRAIPQEGDLILAREAPVGNVAIVPAGVKVCLGQRTVLLRPDKKIVHPEFLNYLLLGNEVQGKFHSVSNGATVKHLNLKDIRALVLPHLPALNEQEKLASIIANYDNLIENNNRRIAIFEDMAQSLYREWFVKFRFPGHENCEFKDSAIGRIPEGWEVMSSSQAIDINPKTKLSKEGEKLFVPMSGLSGSSMVIGDVQMKAGNSGAKYMNGDTLFARITPCLQNGKTGFVQFLTEALPVGFGSTEFIVLRSSRLTPEFVYCLSRSRDFRENAIKSMTGATGRQRVSNECFDSFDIAVPNKKFLNTFSQLAVPVFKEIFNLNQRNENLKKQRDSLLPKLISGKVSITIG
jgi:type I restriction enzyme, S subunit